MMLDMCASIGSYAGSEVDSKYLINRFYEYILYFSVYYR